MQLANLAPNISIMKSPSNWFFVAFALALLALIFHVFANRNSN
jgi:bacteriorhodopsin